MNYSERERERREFKYFVIFGFLTVALLAAFAKVAVASNSEVIVAEEPSNAGGNENDNIIAYIYTDNRIGPGASESVPDNSSAALIAVGPDITDSNVSIEPYGTDILLVNEDDNKDDGMAVENDGSNAINTEEVMDVYVADSDDDCPVSELVPLDVEVQEYIWTRCKKATGDYKNYYAFMLGAIELESSFKRTAVHHNNNGTVDRGLCQINSCNIKECKRAGLITCADDLFDIYKNIDCGFHEMNDCIDKHGVCEDAYYAYNTGKSHGGSNKASRIVMKNMAKWSAVLFPEV